MPMPDPNAELPDEVRSAAAEAEAAVAARAEAARKLADAIDPRPTVSELVDQLDASVERAKEARASAGKGHVEEVTGLPSDERHELRTDATDRAPDPADPEQAAAAAEAQGVLPPGGLALLGPEVASQCRHQVMPDGTAMVILRLEHAAGSTIVGLSMGHALQLSNNIRAEHRKAELATRTHGNGKLLVPGVNVPPPGKLRAPGQ